MLGLSLLAFYCINLLVDCKRALEAKGVVRAPLWPCWLRFAPVWSRAMLWRALW